MSDDRNTRPGHDDHEETRGSHPAGKRGATPPRVDGHVRGVSLAVDTSGECRLVLHLENDVARSRHAVSLGLDAIESLTEQLLECKDTLTRIRELGEAADDALRDWDQIWVPDDAAR